MSSILCVDIGTSSIKGGIVEESGKLFDFAVERLGTGIRDLSNWDPQVWIYTLKRLLLRLELNETISGVVVSGNGPTLIPLAADGSPSSAALLWLDKQEKALAGQSSFFLPKASWLMHHRPEEYIRTKVFLSCPEYINFYLTGIQATITPNSSFRPFIWTDEQIEAYGLDKDKFPPFVYPTEEIGLVRREIADFFDLSLKTRVYAGGPDFLMSLLGTATVESGRTCDRAGTSEGINYCSNKILGKEKVRILPHLIEGKQNIAAILSSTGRLFDWFRDFSGQSARAYQDMLEEIQDHLFHFDKPWFFPSIHEGAGWEFAHGMFIGLGAEHGKEDMGRSVIHSIAFAVREAVEILKENGYSIEALRLSGGQAKNTIWNQIKADVTGKVLLVPEIEDTELLGDACIGFTGQGKYEKSEEAANNLVIFKKEYKPNRENIKIFTDAYERYRVRYEKFRKALSECAAELLVSSESS